MNKFLLVTVLFLAGTISANAQPGVWGTATGAPRSGTTSIAIIDSSSHQGNLSLPRMFFGGGINFGFGDVEYYDLQPSVGLQITHELSSGVSFLYRYRRDSRATQTLTTKDYGGTLFARFNLTPTFFIQSEYEYLNYQYYLVNLEKKRSDISSFLAGAGISQPLGNNSFFYAAMLYNFTYDQSNSPYDTPWTYRVGVSFGF